MKSLTDKHGWLLHTVFHAHPSQTMFSCSKLYNLDHTYASKQASTHTHTHTPVAILSSVLVVLVAGLWCGAHSATTDLSCTLGRHWSSVEGLFEPIGLFRDEKRYQKLRERLLSRY